MGFRKKKNEWNFLGIILESIPWRTSRKHAREIQFLNELDKFAEKILEQFMVQSLDYNWRNTKKKLKKYWRIRELLGVISERIRGVFPGRIIVKILLEILDFYKISLGFHEVINLLLEFILDEILGEISDQTELIWIISERITLE